MDREFNKEAAAANPGSAEVTVAQKLKKSY